MTSPSYKFIRVSEPYRHVLLVELAREPVNAFTFEMWTEYGNIFDSISRGVIGNDIRAVVVSSALEKIFTAGVDLSALSIVSSFPADPARRALHIRSFILAFQSSISSASRCPIPVIAATHGMTVGLGVDLILACDIRLVAQGGSFSIKEVDVGLAADIGTLSRLGKVTGNASLARELAFTARKFSAEEAQRLGLVSKVVEVPQGAGKSPREAVVDAALELAREIASKSPVAVAGTKRLMIHAVDHSIDQNLEYTATWNGVMTQTADLALTTAKPLTQSKPNSSSKAPPKAKTFAPLRGPGVPAKL